jgi:glycosyltransferase involved in cell wall biosynthesis
MRAADPNSSLAPPANRLLVVSHPAVVTVNQEVYLELVRRGWEVTIVVPSRWRHEYSQGTIRPRALGGLAGSRMKVPIALPGRPQRHFYMARCRVLCARVDPDVAFVEEEPFSLAASQWRGPLTRAGVPFGVQCDENIDRALPVPVGWLRGQVLRDAAFVAARSPSAERLVRAWGATGEVELAPHAVPLWEVSARADHSSKPGGGPFRIGYAGRLVESKGLMDLLDAVRLLEAPVELTLIGDGELRPRLEGAEIPGSRVRVRDDLRHEDMPHGYAQLDVLVLPSRTAPTWKEQFGRVIVEALWCGVPVVGSDSGEIPWVIGLTEGGVIFPEGDAHMLARRLTELRAQPALRRTLAERGRAAVQRFFSVPAATDPLERMLLAAIRRRRQP